MFSSLKNNKISDLLKRSLIYGAAYGFGRMIEVLLMPVYTFYLIPKELGVISMLYFLWVMLVQGFSLGLGAAIIKNYHSTKDSQRHKAETVIAAEILVFFSAIVMFALMSLMNEEISYALFRSPDYSYHISIVAVMSVLDLLVIPLMIFIQVEERVKEYSALYISSAIISSVSSLFLVIQVKLGVLGILYGLLAGKVFQLLAVSIRAFPKLGFRWNSTRANEVLNIGLHFLPGIILLVLFHYVNRFMLERYGSLYELGIYTVGLTIGMAIGLPVYGFESAWKPFFVKQKHEMGSSSEVSDISNMFVVAMGALSLVFYAWSGAVEILWIQSEYKGMYQIVGLAATFYYLLGISNLLLPEIYYDNRIGLLSVSLGCGLGLQLITAYHLIPAWGAVGAGIALVVGAVGNVIVLVLYHLRDDKNRGKKYWILFLAIYFVAVSVLFNREEPVNIVDEIIFGLGCTAVISVAFLFLFYLLGNGLGWGGSNDNNLLQAEGDEARACGIQRQAKRLVVFTHCSAKSVPAQGYLLAQKISWLGYKTTVLSGAQTGLGRFFDIAIRGLPAVAGHDVILIDMFGYRAFTYEALAVIYGCFFRKRVVIIIRGGWMADFAKSWPRLTKLIFSLADVTLTPHAFLYEQMTQLGFHIHGTLPNFIEKDRYQFKERNNISPNILYLRGMHPIYNPEMAIRVFAVIQKKYPEATLTMAGKDDKNFELCKKIISEKNIKHVDYLGVIPKGEISNLAQSHDLYIQTNRIDNMPVTVLEMWACGVPVVATSVGGVPYLINNDKDGLIVEPEDYQEMAKKCIELIEDPARAARIARKGKERVELYAWEHVSLEWLKILQLIDPCNKDADSKIKH